MLMSMCGFDESPDKLKRALQGGCQPADDKHIVLLDETPHMGDVPPPPTPH